MSRWQVCKAKPIRRQCAIRAVFIEPNLAELGENVIAAVVKTETPRRFTVGKG
jgi:hypothetical protein